MIELILFIVIIGVGLAGILAAMNLATQRSADPVRRKQALMIAEALLEEVGQAKFSYCDPTAANADTAANTAACDAKEGFGPEPDGGTRPFDNVNDYVTQPGQLSAAFNNGAGALSDINGNALDVTGYSARVSVTPVAFAGIGAAGTAADTDVLRITVQVDYDGQSLTLDTYRTRYAPNSL